MDAPPVQYLTTYDGCNIAYSNRGQGQPLVFLPLWANHVQEVWTGSTVGWLLDGLAEHFSVINYDARGMGMSTRGLPEDLSLEHYIRDLEALMERLGLERVVLLGSHSSALLAAQYAARFPERVTALVLNNCGIDWPGVQLPSLWDDLARQSWEAFLYSLIPNSYPREDAHRITEKFGRWITQNDYLAALPVWRDASLNEVISRVLAPTLVLKPKLCPCSLVEGAIELAQRLPDGRLALLDSDWSFGEPTEALDVIEAFLSELHLETSEDDKTHRESPATFSRLSLRQAQVLRLIAEGKTNGEIADQLVISLRTVERHVAELYAKIGVRNRVEAAAFAMSHLARA